MNNGFMPINNIYGKKSTIITVEITACIRVTDAVNNWHFF